MGGGYPEHDLSDITLEWMVKKAEADGLRIYRRVPVNPNAEVSAKPVPQHVALILDGYKGAPLQQIFRLPGRAVPTLGGGCTIGITVWTR